MLRPTSIAILTTAVCLSASAFASTTYYVGTCHKSAPIYSTISAAVSSVPSGSTVLVCPGNYPEQVLITRPLTLKGLPGQGAASVVVPLGGVLTQYNSAQILVQNPGGPVTITNLVVDGTGGTIPNPALGGSIVGIDYQNTSGGSISYTSVRNQAGCLCGIGIEVYGDGGALEIYGNVVRGQDSGGVFVANSSPNIRANTVHPASGVYGGISLAQIGG